MPPPTPAAPYRAWLLRCWHERGAAGPGGGWRFSLEEPGTGVRRGFASLAALLAFLEATLAGGERDRGGGAPREPTAPPKGTQA